MDMSREIRRSMQKNAKKRNSTPHHSVEREFFTRQDVNQILKRRDDLWLSYIGPQIGDLVGDAVSIELYMNDILHTVAVYRGNELRERITQQDIEGLEQLFLPIKQFANRTNGNIEFIEGRTSELHQAMRKLVDQNDETALRTIVDTLGVRHAIIAAYRDTWKRSGPKNRRNWRLQLRDMCIQVENDNPDFEPRQVRYKILDMVGVRDTAMHYTPRIGVDNAQEIIDSLYTKEAKEKPSVYFTRLKEMAIGE